MLFPPLKANMEQELHLKCRNIPTILSDLSFIKYWLMSKNVGIFLQTERSVLNWTELNSSNMGTDVHFKGCWWFINEANCRNIPTI